VRNRHGLTRFIHTITNASFRSNSSRTPEMKGPGGIGVISDTRTSADHRLPSGTTPSHGRRRAESETVVGKVFEERAGHFSE